MKVIKPGDYTWIFTLSVQDGFILPTLKLLEVDSIGYDQDEQEWIFYDKEGNEYEAKDCIETDYQITEEKLDA